MSRPLVITKRLSAGPQGQAERRPHRTPPTNPTAFLAPFANGSSSPQRLDHSEICIRAASWVVIHSEGDNLLPSFFHPSSVSQAGPPGLCPDAVAWFSTSPTSSSAIPCFRHEMVQAPLGLSQPWTWSRTFQGALSFCWRWRGNARSGHWVCTLPLVSLLPGPCAELETAVWRCTRMHVCSCQQTRSTHPALTYSIALALSV